jgi:uncharacterized protein YdeI (YjbR/CyaY-like superfamily)
MPKSEKKTNIEEGDPESREIPIPEDLELFLNENPEVYKNFNSFSPSHRRELLIFMNKAKHAETRLKRINKIISFILKKAPPKNNRKKFWLYK